MSNLFVQQKAEQSTSSVASFTTSAMTVAAGNAIVSATSGYIDAPLVTTDSLGDSFIAVVSDQHTGASSETVSLEVATNLIGGSTTFTVTPGAPAVVSICVQEYSGMAASPTEATSHANTGVGSALVVPGDLDVLTPGDLYVSAWTHVDSPTVTFTAEPGFTLRANLTDVANQPLGSQDLIGSGSQACTAVLGGSAYWAACAAAFKAADAVTPGMSPAFAPVEFPMTDRGFGDG